MDLNIIIGSALVVAALGGLAALVFWSRRRIERIARMKSRTARQIEKELRGGRQ